MTRRNFIRYTTLSALGINANTVISKDNVGRLQPTPDETEGPFYPVRAQQDKDLDLTKVTGQEHLAQGKHIVIEGQVVDTTGQAIEGAEIDLWQANAAGKYAHPRDPNPALIDKNFQGWAIIPSGIEGRFRIKTVMPGAYPASNAWMRPPHIHLKVAKQGYEKITTQMYFPDQPLNQLDYLLQRKSPDEQQLMIAQYVTKAKDTFFYRIVLEDV